MSELVKVHRNTDLGMKLPVYDGRRGLYTAGKLPFTSKQFSVTIVDDLDWVGITKYVLIDTHNNISPFPMLIVKKFHSILKTIKVLGFHVPFYAISL